MNWAFYIRSVPFTKSVILGETSLGGSESAAVGVARALVARGHRVVIFAADLADTARGRDPWGVLWEPHDLLMAPHGYLHWEWDACVSLRMTEVFEQAWIPARWRVLWNQDLLLDGGDAKGQAQAVMSALWSVDTLAYVSAYHRAQWEGLLPYVKDMGWVTRNGFDPDVVPVDVPKDDRVIIHISRPERGLTPILRMWPLLKLRRPQAILQLARYSSMYDAAGWGRICEAYDAEVARVNRDVGGIEYLGELNKPDLYQAISRAAVMWYPGVADFAETSCIAAIEAQACGTPFVGSYRGALPETVPHGVLIKGDPMTPAYQNKSVDAVLDAMHGCEFQTSAYLDRQQFGREHVERYTFDVLAAEWEARARQEFETRRAANPAGILRRLLEDDDHCAALPLALEVGDEAAIARCGRVIAGLDQVADQYAEAANRDTIAEAEIEPRLKLVAGQFGQTTHLLDVACGNGAFAIAVARRWPTLRVTGVDYSADLVEQATAAAEAEGVSDRVRFEQAIVYDYERHTLHADMAAFVAAHAETFDGLFCGEFLEHCANSAALIDGLEPALIPGATVIYTCPHGPFMQLMPEGVPIHRGHVHHFQIDDLFAVFGDKVNADIRAMDMGVSRRGELIGHWLIGYEYQPDHPAGDRDLAWRALSTRPMPMLSVGLIVKNAATDLDRCLVSVRKVADEIVIGDTGSIDRTVDIARAYTDKVLQLLPVEHQPDGFAGARNQVLAACTGDWFLWIDADETLEHAAALRRYLETGPYLGYCIRQNHLMIDAPSHFDEPVRVFRRRPDIQFYGCVHEQPQQGDCNTDIMPALGLLDVQIAHIGYRTEDLRRRKQQRNLPLLLRNRERFPTRVLNDVLEIRECVLRGSDELAQGNTVVASSLFSRAIALYEEQFVDPTHKYHRIARPFYEQALQHVPSSCEFEVSFAGTRGALNGRRAKPTRFRARRYEDIELFMRRLIEPSKELFAVPSAVTNPDEVRDAVRQ